jgi:phosphoribosyl 1,2-cyclic phosphodiesterase
MSFQFCSLGSGSEGNALLVDAASGATRTRLMMDCGFGLADTETRLARVGLDPAQLDAIVVTHEHADHIGGVARLARKYSIPVWMTHGTARLIGERTLPRALLHYVDPHASFRVGDIEVTPFTVPHDANEPVQYVFGNGAYRLGVLTDVGVTTPHIESSLSHCDALVLEANHDLDMLLAGPYPYSLKQRVSGRFGHLDNQAAAALLARVAHPGLAYVVAAHLSRQNNTPALAQRAFASALNTDDDAVVVASQDAGFGWIGWN